MNDMIFVPEERKRQRVRMDDLSNEGSNKYA